MNIQRIRRFPFREALGLILLTAGELLLATGLRPAADYYFPLVWFGYILVLDGAHERLMGWSLWTRCRNAFLLMVPLSAVFWWIFELFDSAVHSWRYIGGDSFSIEQYVALASISFATVLLAVWETALCLHAALDSGDARRLRSGTRFSRSMRGTLHGFPGHGLLQTSWTMPCSLLFGIGCVVLPIAWPQFAFGLIWGSLFFLLDPINYWLGRPSLLAQALRGSFQTTVSFAVAALICGFFWESWNYWAPVKWVYNVPYVSHWHLFEMPVPGYAGYLPFGLELYAMAVFVLSPLAKVFRFDLRLVPFLDVVDRVPDAMDENQSR